MIIAKYRNENQSNAKSTFKILSNKIYSVPEFYHWTLLLNILFDT